MPKKPRRKPKNPSTRLFMHRIRTPLYEQIQTFVLEEVDEYGNRRYRSMAQFVDESLVKNLPRNRVTHRSTT